MPLPYVVIQAKVPRELWAWVASHATREGQEKQEIVIAALEEYRKHRKEV
jgi:hypothetical protein